eukprot:829310-Lingulodinium_polyedra.AAC.1
MADPDEHEPRDGPRDIEDWQTSGGETWGPPGEPGNEPGNGTAGQHGPGDLPRARWETRGATRRR